jgi:hypothetical protein
MNIKRIPHLLLSLVWLPLFAISAVAQLSNEQLSQKLAPAVVLILTGQGSGQLQATGSGFILKEDGVILTAFHLIKDAREVQVRLKSGEVYDQVELLGIDRRRDVAALRVRAKGLPVLSVADAEAAQVGEKIFTMSNAGALSWSASDGILSSIRMADDIPAAGTGFKVLQFTAPVSAGSSGAPIVDAQGRALGIIIASSRGQSLNFAIPVNNVAGLADVASGTPLGDGSSLRLPVKTESLTSAVIAETNADEQLRGARTLRIYSRTEFFSESQLENKLINHTDFKAMNLKLLDDYKGGDFTYKITDTRTNVILATGKVAAWDSVTAAPELAKQIIKKLQTPRPKPTPTSAKTK